MIKPAGSLLGAFWILTCLATAFGAPLAGQSATAPTVTVDVKTCSVTVRATPPDANPGWRAQFKRDGANLGGRDAAAPYEQTATVTRTDASTVSVVWTKGDVTLTTPPAPLVCANAGGVVVPAPTPTPTPTPLPTPPPASAAGLLEPSDVTYQGYYEQASNGTNSSFAKGLAHRYVNGDLHLFLLDVGNTVREVPLAGKAFGDTLDDPLQSWQLGALEAGSARDFTGIYWNETDQRLWWTTSGDYTATDWPIWINRVVLNPNGTLGNHHYVDLIGSHAKRAYGGIQAIPAALQALFGGAKYVTGWGGYTSLLAQGGGASLGATMYAFGDPTTAPHNAHIPMTTVMDHTTLSAADWYRSRSPSDTDRGRRLSRPTNYFDGGDYRPSNQDPPPTQAPKAGAQWLSPAPDGFGRFVWGDSYYGTGMWISGPNKRGFVLIASLGCGKTYYQAASLAYDARCFELHIFDPFTLANAFAGRIRPWQVQPASMSALTLPGLGGDFVPWGNITQSNAPGATYDPVSKRLFVLGAGAGGTDHRGNRIFVFKVAD